MPLKIYNTLTRKVEEFKPLRENTVYIYWCGQTVYDSPHLGHARTYLVADMIRRWLKYRGYSVFYVENITDIDDKIIRRANELGISYKELAEKYIRELEEVMSKLGIHVDYRPRATEHIPEMIQLIKKLFDRGYAYEIDDGVYFDVSKFKEYGKLSGQKFEDLVKHRIEPNPNKRNPGDFALWKKQKPGEPAWDSPWGKGRPGWHIECSAMAMRYLGETFDIHGGGADLIFPHHENEIAQSEAATEKPFARYWIHVGLLQIRGEKMAKSLGNIIPIKKALERWKPEVIRLYLLSTHYRKPFEFSEKGLEDAAKNLQKLYNTIERLYRESEENIQTRDQDKILRLLNDSIKRFEDFMDDDFNSAGALSVLFELASELNRYLDEKGKLDRKIALKAIGVMRKMGWVFGILQSRMEIERDFLNKLMDIVIEVRSELRKRKEYELADKIRERLKEIGIQLEDIKDKTIWRMS